jgi:hypothetical protein
LRPRRGLGLGGGDKTNSGSTDAGFGGRSSEGIRLGDRLSETPSGSRLAGCRGMGADIKGLEVEPVSLFQRANVMGDRGSGS